MDTLGNKKLIKKLLKASKKGNVDAVQALLTNGAEVNAKDKDGNTALMMAARNGHTATVQFLLDRDVNVNAKDKDGFTALMWTAWGGHTETVQVLLANGAEVNAKSKDGTTALMRAAFGGHTEAVRVLLANGAEVNAKSKDGATAVRCARVSGNDETLQVFLDLADGKVSSQNYKISFWQSKGWKGLRFALILFVVGIMFVATGWWFEGKKWPILHGIFGLVGGLMIFGSFYEAKEALFSKKEESADFWENTIKTTILYCPHCGKNLSYFEIPSAEGTPYQCSECGRTII